jgi:quinol monooxygenase YgiN
MTESRSDPGVTIDGLHRSTADPALWFLYERYESQEHFNRSGTRTSAWWSPLLNDGDAQRHALWGRR